MVGSSIYTVTSVLTQRELDLFCSTYNILAELRPELPDRNSTIINNPEGKIGINGWLSFSKRGGAGDPCCVSKKFDSLKNWNNHFFWINDSVYPLSLPWFNGTSVVKDPLPMDEAVDLPCAELLNENRTLIRKYPETFLCLVGLSRSFVEMDVCPTLLHGDNEEMGLLDFVKTADPFKVKTGERTLAEVSLLTETEDRVFSPSSQHTSLVDHTIQDELNVNSGKRKKRVAFTSGSLPVKKAQTEGIVIYDARTSTAGKSPSALQRLSRQNKQASTGFGSAAPVTEDVTSSFATPTPDFYHEDASHDNVRTRSTPGRFVVTSSESTDVDVSVSPQVVPPVTLDSAGATVPVAAPTGGDHPASGSGPEAGTLSATPSQGSSADDFYESQTIDSTAAQNIYVPNWNVINNDRLASLVTCRNLLDHVTPPAYWSAFRNQHDTMFLDALNVNSAQHVCMVSELRLRYEHEIMIREKFEKKFTESAAIVQQRDAEIVDLTLRQTITWKVGELANLRTDNVSLSERVFALELERDGLKDQVVGEGKMREEFLSQQDAAEQHFKERAAELDGRIADVCHDMDTDLYPHMLTAIAGRRWVVGHGFRLAVHKCANSIEYQSALGKVILMAINKGMHQGLEAGVVHGQAGRPLTQIEAYDPKVEGKYVEAVYEFEDLSFSLLDELEGLKDAPPSALTLKDSEGDKDISSKLSRFQPSLDQVTVPIYSESGSIYRKMPLSDAIPSIRRSAERRGLCPPSGIAPGEASGSAPSHDTTLAIADYQVSTLVLSGDGASVDQLPVVEPHDDLFDASVLAEPSGV
ncbi:hypothetical protein Tco_1447913 [Tanacetum coccineum]